MDSNWVRIYSSTQAHKVEIVKSVLLDNNINSVVLNKKDSSYLFGEIELCVEKESVIRAKHIMKLFKVNYL